GERAGDDAAVDLGQRDVHDDVARAETTRAGAPGFRVAAGEDDLQNRAIEDVEGCRATFSARRRHGKARGVENDAGRRRREDVGDDGGGLRILEALYEEGQRV